MTHVRNFFTAAALTFVLAGATLADDGIIYGGYMPTPTPTPVVRTNSIGDGNLSPKVAEEPSENTVTATDIVIESALRVLGGMFLLY